MWVCIVDVGCGCGLWMRVTFRSLSHSIVSFSYVHCLFFHSLSRRDSHGLSDVDGKQVLLIYGEVDPDTAEVRDNKRLRVLLEHFSAHDMTLDDLPAEGRLPRELALQLLHALREVRQVHFEPQSPVHTNTRGLSFCTESRRGWGTTSDIGTSRNFHWSVTMTPRNAPW